jgi:hypothetical protein
MNKIVIVLASLFVAMSFTSFGQSNYTTEPSEAQFITSDIPRFWEAFDKIDKKVNPFKKYIDEGTDGLIDFIPHRIESPKNLLKIVKSRRGDYASKREESYQVENHIDQMREAYRSFKEWHADAVFPPSYFVIGAFNSGGTSSDNGMIMGVEVQTDIDNLPYIVAHELIHFNQDYPNHRNTLLHQSIMEGSADFVGELISGKSINAFAFEYGETHSEELCREFVEIMNEVKYKGWLYGSKGKKKGRPNDLGYWMGYKICEAYFAKALNQKEAIRDILNIEDFDEFLGKSGFLSAYIGK